MLILSTWGGSILALEVPTITISKGDKINLTVSALGGSEGVAATKILQTSRIISSGENPVWGADSRHIIFAEGGTLYLLDTVTSRKSKILDGVSKITEPSWSR